MNGPAELISSERIGNRILAIRGQKVILDSDLATLYEVTTSALNQAVKRNAERFPDDFVFQLTQEEFARLTSQSVTSNGRGGRRRLPYAFTEHGAIMAASVLNSPRAVEVSIFVVRAFVRLREVIASHKDLARKLDQLERKLATHDDQILMLIHAIRQLATPPRPEKRRRIGFHADKEC